MMNNPRTARLINNELESSVSGTNLESLFAVAERLNAVTPLQSEKLLHLDAKPEFYYINPLFTLFLRDAALAGSHALTPSRTAFVQYRLWWEVQMASKIINEISKDKWDDMKLLMLETFGLWNLVASLMHAQKQAAGTPVSVHSPSPVVRLLIQIGTVLTKYMELVPVIRPYLEEELKRHFLQLTELANNQNWIYSILKLAYYLRYSGRASIWEQIDKALQAAERFLANGNVMTGVSEIAFMEIRTVEANRHSEAGNSDVAISLIERNLRFQPRARDQTLPAMKSDIYRNFLMLAYEETRASNPDQPTPPAADIQAYSPERLESQLTGMLDADDDRQTFFDSFAEPVSEIIFFRNFDKARIESFSPLAREVFSGSLWEVVGSSMTPQVAERRIRDMVQRYVQSANFDLNVADLRITSGDGDNARRILHDRLRRQGVSTNDAGTNYSLHLSLSKRALQEEKWRTAAEHLKAMISSGQEGTWCYTWLQIARCYDKLGDIDQLRVAALKALEVAQQYWLETETDRYRQMFDALRELTEISSIANFRCVFPVRLQHESTSSTEEPDRLNPVLLFWRILLIVYRPENEPVYNRNGILLRNLIMSVLKFGGIVRDYNNSNGRPSDWPPQLSAELCSVLSTFNWFLRDVHELGKRFTDDDISKEAERWLFLSEPASGVLSQTAWYKTAEEDAMSLREGRSGAEEQPDVVNVHLLRVDLARMEDRESHVVSPLTG